MKTLILAAMTLGLSSAVYATDLNSDSLATLLTSQNLSVSGDVHSYETFKSIYENAINNGDILENTCEVISLKAAECTLYLTNDYSETAVVYSVYLPGNKLVSNRLYISRGH